MVTKYHFSYFLFFLSTATSSYEEHQEKAVHLSTTLINTTTPIPSMLELLRCHPKAKEDLHDGEVRLMKCKQETEAEAKKFYTESLQDAKAIR